MLALLGLGSSLVWGTSDFVGGLLTRRRPAAAVVGWSQAIAFVVLTALVLVRGDLSWGAWGPPGIAAGLTGAGALICFYAALAAGTMGVVAPIASLGVAVPVVVGLAAGDRPGPLAIVGIVVAVIGVVLASGPELQGGVSARPVALAALAGVGFGLTFVFLDLGAEHSLLHTLWAMRTTSAALFATAALVLRTTGGITRRDLPVLAGVGLADLAANALFALAAGSGLISVVSVLASLYPVVTVLLARAFLHERLRPIQLWGVALTMLGAATLAGA
ncbi:EamA family transporter [Janibacter sp. G1551]|uniref:EamA family transporter n=1 Tax=Janibacter sp. G1551 TaxID=3420440 RepID=UPI003CFF4753